MWFACTILAAALYAVTNHFDKYIHNRYPSGPTSGVIPLAICLFFAAQLPVIYVMKPSVTEVSSSEKHIMLLAGVLYVGSLVFYHAALRLDEASRVSPLFRLTPFCAYVFGVVGLGETLGLQQVAGAGLILFGAIIMTVSRNFRIKKWRVLLLMFLSSAFMAGNAFLFKLTALDVDFWSATYWQTAGISLGGSIILLFRSNYLSHFLTILSKDKMFFVTVIGADTTIVIGARLLSGAAVLDAPIALVSIVNSFQSVFVILLGVVITRYFPRFGKEEIHLWALLHKLFPTVFLIIGSAMILLA